MFRWWSVKWLQLSFIYNYPHAHLYTKGLTCLLLIFLNVCSCYGWKITKALSGQCFEILFNHYLSSVTSSLELKMFFSYTIELTSTFLELLTATILNVHFSFQHTLFHQLFFLMSLMSIMCHFACVGMVHCVCVCVCVHRKATRCHRSHRQSESSTMECREKKWAYIARENPANLTLILILYVMSHTIFTASILRLPWINVVCICVCVYVSVLHFHRAIIRWWFYWTKSMNDVITLR